MSESELSQGESRKAAADEKVVVFKLFVILMLGGATLAAFSASTLSGVILLVATALGIAVLVPGLSSYLPGKKSWIKTVAYSLVVLALAYLGFALASR